ncbi:MAG: hypothetical protein JNN01_19170 [Opitutaceae bacterium]|nr:hypothetical protein [Opitutaceae bacterium]
MLSFRAFLALGLNSLLQLGLVAVALGTGGGLGAAEGTVAARDDFSPMVKLAPFVVQGESLAVSIHARSGRDRRYAERFSEEVIKVVYEGLTPSTGRGLVIIGKEGEPHPIRFFRRFLALADAGQLDPAVAARGPELYALLNHWERSIEQRQGKGTDDRKGGTAHLDDMDIDVEQIFTALPLPLEGVGARLYQLAWAEKFEDAKVEARLRSLKAADLESTLFTRFDWVFYLPPRNALDRMLDALIAAKLKEEKAGLMARMAVKSVMLIVKPKLRRVFEALRKGMLLETVADARTSFSQPELNKLMGAYIEALVPDQDDDDKDRPAVPAGSEHERAVKAVAAAAAAAELPPKVEE